MRGQLGQQRGRSTRRRRSRLSKRSSDRQRRRAEGPTTSWRPRQADLLTTSPAPASRLSRGPNPACSLPPHRRCRNLPPGYAARDLLARCARSEASQPSALAEPGFGDACSCPGGLTSPVDHFAGRPRPWPAGKDADRPLACLLPRLLSGGERPAVAAGARARRPVRPLPDRKARRPARRAARRCRRRLRSARRGPGAECKIRGAS